MKTVILNNGINKEYLNKINPKISVEIKNGKVININGNPENFIGSFCLHENYNKLYKEYIKELCVITEFKYSNQISDLCTLYQETTSKDSGNIKFITLSPVISLTIKDNIIISAEIIQKGIDYICDNNDARHNRICSKEQIWHEQIYKYDDNGYILNPDDDLVSKDYAYINSHTKDTIKIINLKMSNILYREHYYNNIILEHDSVYYKFGEIKVDKNVLKGIFQF